MRGKKAELTSGDREKGQRTGPGRRRPSAHLEPETTAWREAAPGRGVRETEGVDSKALHTR